MRRAPVATRRALVPRLMPEMLFLLPPLSTPTATGGWPDRYQRPA
jgi:hypothetical protein